MRRMHMQGNDLDTPTGPSQCKITIVRKRSAQISLPTNILLAYLFDGDI